MRGSRRGINTVDEEGNPISPVVVTTPGRMYLADILPRSPKVPFSLINRLLTKREITTVIDEVYRHCGQKETCIFADRMMSLGFGQAARAGFRSVRMIWSFRTRRLA